jgi:hypothetical protein
VAERDLICTEEEKTVIIEAEIEVIWPQSGCYQKLEEARN